MAYVVTLRCLDIKDKGCLLECPVDCIYEGDRMLYIHPAECIDCGACEPACPNDAISYEAELVGEMEPFAQAAHDFFATLPAKPLSGKDGPLAHDAPYIRTLSVQPSEGRAG